MKMERTVMLSAMVLLLGGGPAFMSDLAAAEGEPVVENEIDEVLARLEDSFAGFLDWLAPLYNKEQKGFHLARSSLSAPDKYICAIDTTGQALGILYRTGMMDAMPDSMRKDLIEFFQSKQNPNDGFFRDNVPPDQWNARLSQRARNTAVAALRYLGAAPLHDLPREEAVLTSFPELRSKKAFVAYLRQLNWNRPWEAGDWSSVRARMADSLDEPLRSEIVGSYFEFLESKQSSETGFWGANPRKKDYNYVSGVMKISFIFRLYERKVPEADRILDSILWVLKNDRVITDYCHVRNVLTALENIRPDLEKAMTPEQIRVVIANTVRNHLRFAKPDGGFSRHLPRAFTGERPLVVGRGLVEGDMNAGTQAVHPVRSFCYELAGREPPVLKGAESFYKKVRIGQ